MVETGGVVVAAEMAKEVLKKVKSSVWPKEALEKVEERLTASFVWQLTLTPNCYSATKSSADSARYHCWRDTSGEDLPKLSLGDTHSSRHSILREVLNARETQLIGQLHK